MSLKLLVKSAGKIEAQKGSQQTLCAQVESFLTIFDYFLRLSKFPDLFDKVFLMSFKLS